MASLIYAGYLKTIDHLNMKLSIFSSHIACFKIEFLKFRIFELSPMEIPDRVLKLGLNVVTAKTMFNVEQCMPMHGGHLRVSHVSLKS